MSLVTFEGYGLETYVPELQDLFKRFSLKNTKQYVVRKINDGHMDFHDPKMLYIKAPSLAGVVYFEKGGGRGGSDVYCVRSRLIKNGKHRMGSSGYKTLKTNDAAKAVKYMLQYLVPLEYSEIRNHYANVRKEFHDKWLTELSWPLRREIDIDHNEILQEVDRLHTMGVQFIGNGFQKAVKNLDKWKESLRRQKLKFNNCYVILDEDKAVTIVRSKRNPSEDYYEDKETVYERQDLLPESIYGKVSLLKMLEDGKGIPEVGVRVNQYQYWVFEEVTDA